MKVSLLLFSQLNADLNELKTKYQASLESVKELETKLAPIEVRLRTYGIINNGLVLILVSLILNYKDW